MSHYNSLGLEKTNVPNCVLYVKFELERSFCYKKRGSPQLCFYSEDVVALCDITHDNPAGEKILNDIFASHRLLITHLVGL